MSSQDLQSALQDAGISKNVAQKAIKVLLGCIEDGLASNGKFVMRGIGRLEVVPNQRRSSSSVIGGDKAKKLPVRVRFEVSRELKKKIANAYPDA